MDNDIVDVRALGREAFDHALALFMPEGSGRKATHSAVVPAGASLPGGMPKTEVVDAVAPTLVLFWTEPREWDFGLAVPFLVALRRQEAADLAWMWLAERSMSEHAERIDIDGSLGRGFRVFNEAWCRVGNAAEALCAVRPVCAWLGK